MQSSGFVFTRAHIWEPTATRSAAGFPKFSRSVLNPVRSFIKKAQSVAEVNYFAMSSVASTGDHTW